MAAYDALKAFSTSLTTTVVDTVILTQLWDAIEIVNRDTANGISVRFDATSPTALGEDCEFIFPSETKVFRNGIVRPNPTPGSTASATACHEVRIIGNGGGYTVAGIAGPV